MPRIALWGGLSSGIDSAMPSMPTLVMVKVPPCRSVGSRRLRSVACCRRTISVAISASESWSAFRTTGTTKPRSEAMATPRLTVR